MSITFKWCKDKTKLTTYGKQVFCIDEFGDKYWYLNGQRHRVNCPAVEYADGTKEWWLNGKIYYVSDYWKKVKEKEWWLNGKIYSDSGYWKEVKK